MDKDIKESIKQEEEEDELLKLPALRGVLLPKALVDQNKELVEGLDGWSIRKGAYITIRSSLEAKGDAKKVDEEKEGTFKTQTRPLGFTKRNTISLDMLKRVQSNKARPSLKLAQGSGKLQILLPSITSVRLPSIASIDERSEGKDDDNASNSDAGANLPIKYNEDADDNIISPLRTSIGDLLMTNAKSKQVNY